MDISKLEVPPKKKANGKQAAARILPNNKDHLPGNPSYQPFDPIVVNTDVLRVPQVPGLSLLANFQLAVTRNVLCTPEGESDPILL